MFLSFQQRMDYQGSYLRKPTIFFSAIVPEDSEVFSLVRKDALDDLLRLFAAGSAKFTDRDPKGRSLLKVWLPPLKRKLIDSNYGSMHALIQHRQYVNT